MKASLTMNDRRRKTTLFSFLCFMTLLFSCESTTSSDPTLDQFESLEEVDVDSTHINESALKTQAEIDSIHIAESDPVEEEPVVDLSTTSFIKQLKSGGELSPFFSDSWTFRFYESDRCDGYVAGEIDNLKREQIDQVITVNVATDPDGGGCNPTGPKNFDVEFSLKEEVADWNKVFIGELGPREKNVVYITTEGENYYMKVSYSEDHKIVKLNYNMVAP